MRPLVSQPALLLGTLLLGAVTSASAQWAPDAALNTAVADRGSDQSQAKLAPTPDGGVWVSWFDGIGTGWDVRVQKLDIGGSEVLAHGGVLVENRSFSSTQDYGLDSDPDGNALLAYRDDGGTGVQIGAAKVAPDGTVLWNVQVTSTTAFVAAPKVCGLSDGGVVVAWTQDSSTMLTWLDANGAPTGPNASLTPGVGSFGVNDLHDSGTDAIVSFTHQTGGFGSPRRILTQKYSSTAVRLWGLEPRVVFNTGSLQFGNFPSFIPDGSGGAVFSWYDAGSLQLQCYVQRFLAAGTAAFPLNGVAVSTDATRVRVSPSVAFDASTSETYVFWTEQNSGQSQSGVYGQKLDANGARQWGTDGAVLVPVGSDSYTQVNTLIDVNGSGALVCWDHSPSFGNDVFEGVHVDAAGAISTGPFDVASTPSSKSRMALARTTSGTAALAWKDDRLDGGDILAQNVNEDGTLGARWTDLGGASVGINGKPALTAFGPLTAGSPVGLSLTAGPNSQPCLLWISLAPVPAPFFGGVLHVFPKNAQILLATNGAGGVAGQTTFPAGFPSGSELWFQFLMQDLSTVHGITLSNALRATTP